MLKAVLIDDEESNLSSLREKLTKHCPQVSILACCDNAVSGSEAINTLQPDLVFLDIEMPVTNGFLMLQQLQNKDFELIFVTAYDHYAIRAIKYSALDYLLKPIVVEELKDAVAKAENKRNHPPGNPQIELLLEHLQKNSSRRIAIPTGEGLAFIRVDEIIYLEASINYTHIYLEDKRRFLVSRTLKEFEDILPEETFLRIHHSHIINKNFVERYIRGEGGQVVMQQGITLDVSKRKKADFLQAIGQ
jgi:two-component system LytT family response regulator